MIRTYTVDGHEVHVRLVCVNINRAGFARSYSTTVFAWASVDGIPKWEKIVQLPNTASVFANPDPNVSRWIDGHSGILDPILMTKFTPPDPDRYTPYVLATDDIGMMGRYMTTTKLDKNRARNERVKPISLKSMIESVIIPTQG